MQLGEYTRREFSKLGLGFLASTAGLEAAGSVVRGVVIGAQSYSFRDRSFDEMIKAMKKVGLTYLELWSGHIEPRRNPGENRRAYRERLRRWRLSVPLDHFHEIRQKLDRAGITLYAYNYSMRDDFTDEEIARGFEMAKALGVTRITSSSNLNTVPRIDRYASKAKIYVGMHNHSRLRPNEFARPEDFEKAMAGRSEYIAINLDIGHFVAAGFDPVDYIRKRHDRIITLHIKDRKKNQGPNVPFGQGDTPIAEILRLLRDNQWKIPAMIEYEYKGHDTVEEVRRCFEYCKKVLSS